MMHLTKQEAAPFQALAVGHKSGVLVEPSVHTMWTHGGMCLTRHSEAAFSRQKEVPISGSVITDVVSQSFPGS